MSIVNFKGLIGMFTWLTVEKLQVSYLSYYNYLELITALCYAKLVLNSIKSDIWPITYTFLNKRNGLKRWYVSNECASFSQNLQFVWNKTFITYCKHRDWEILKWQKYILRLISYIYFKKIQFYVTLWPA